jgi:hypothetical protein
MKETVTLPAGMWGNIVGFISQLPGRAWGDVPGPTIAAIWAEIAAAQAVPVAETETEGETK